ncbi:unnamed protein product [Adineta steineri]|uniref:Uncharacterized protein n=1 Tax=Adineta steineri TaxID=433720 RepID=A0A813MMI3_9BILA|nr:unnamed protein product [Adineta steineri]CAF1319719.1 unnamed protein product [Adineta steineri]
METENKDEVLSNFIAITQCSNEEATRYLEAAQWNAQTAMEIFFDNGGSQAGEPAVSSNIAPPATNTNQNAPGQIASGGTGGYESDDEGTMQSAIEESLRANASAAKSTESKGDKHKKSTAPPSKFGTIGGLHNDDDSSEEEGQAFYAGGSERSGQQIIGPSKNKGKDNDKKVAKIFEAARKQGAMEADDDNEDGSSPHARKEKPFGGVGYTLGDDSTPSRSYGQSIGGPPSAAASSQPEQLPLRFYSNGFTIGDGELRKFDENKEFMDCIKRGEVPPELRALSAGGRQVEVRLEDHRGEEYKPVAPQFKPFGGSGYMLGSPAPNVAQSATTTQSSMKSSMASSSSTPSASTDSNRLEKLAEQQLKTSSSSTTIRLRLPDLSTPVRVVIDLTRTLADVRKFLTENVPSLQSNQFEFIEPPSTKIKREDESKTIGDARLTNATLAIRRST